MRLRALIVEDNKDDALLAVRELEKAGYKVTHLTIATEKDMKDALKGEPWDVVISDHSMPGFSSQEALSVLQKSGQDIPFIVLSGTLLEETAIDVMRSGAHDYITKKEIKRLGIIVEREIAEADQRKKLHEAEAIASLQSQILENMSEGVQLTRYTDNCIMYANPRFEKMFGYKPGEIIGKDVSILNAPTDKTPEEIKEEIICVLKKTCRWQGEIKNIRKDGTMFWCWASVSVFNHPEHGEVCISIHTDITKRKEAEEALRNSESRYRTIVENINDALHIIDLKGNILDVNDNACKQLGYTREELIGKNIADIDSNETAKDIQKKLARIGTDKSAVFESSEVRKDGSSLPVEVSAKLVSRKGKGIIQAFIRDISNRKKAEEEQAASYKKLKITLEGTVKAITMISSMRDPYTAGHELRVSELVVAIAKEMTLPTDEIDELRVVSMLHDIGKVCVPSEILSKPGRLSEVEFEMIKSHSRVGQEIIKEAALPCNIAKTILQHHERLDGSGYPDGIKKDEINLGACIIAVADVVEAMSSHRPYRPALGIDVALEEIEKNKGKLYDPDVVDLCLRVFKEKEFTFSEMK